MGRVVAGALRATSESAETTVPAGGRDASLQHRLNKLDGYSKPALFASGVSDVTVNSRAIAQRLRRSASRALRPLRLGP
jgi:hypothetical protein